VSCQRQSLSVRQYLLAADSTLVQTRDCLGRSLPLELAGLLLRDWQRLKWSP